MIYVNSSWFIVAYSPESQHRCPHDVGYTWMKPDESNVMNTFAVTCADEQGKLKHI